MTKYTVRGPIESKLDDYYIMENGEEMTFFDLQAQAEICAFALNGIAAGGRLSVNYGYVNKDHGFVQSYGGPTEGVRP